MPLRYKIDILSALKEKEYTSYKLINEKHLSSSSVQKLRDGKILAPDGLAKLCELLHLQPGDILEYTSEMGNNAPQQ